jgi:hypothetical protein
MPLLALALLLLLPLAVIALMPVILWQRYRAGTARRLARPWLASLNLAAMVMSTVMFVLGATVANIWVPGAVRAVGAGLAFGVALGVLGLWLTRWEATPRTLHYTPNRWLVLGVTLVVSARVVYGFWRAGVSWSALGSDGTWSETFGVAGSLGAAGIVVGYYLCYVVGLRWRIGRWQRRPLRPM